MSWNNQNNARLEQRKVKLLIHQLEIKVIRKLKMYLINYHFQYHPKKQAQTTDEIARYPQIENLTTNLK